MQLVNKNPSAVVLRQFGWAMVLGFGVIGAVLWYFGPEPNSFSWAAARPQKIAVGLWGLGLLLCAIAHGPVSLARPVYVTWMTVAMKMGGVMTIVLLSVLFVVLLPVFSLIRFKDPLRLKLKAPGESYWEDHVHHESTLERMIRPF